MKTLTTNPIYLKHRQKLLAQFQILRNLKDDLKQLEEKDLPTETQKMVTDELLNNFKYCKTCGSMSLSNIASLRILINKINDSRIQHKYYDPS